MGTFAIAERVARHDLDAGLGGRFRGWQAAIVSPCPETAKGRMPWLARTWTTATAAKAAVFEGSMAEAVIGRPLLAVLQRVIGFIDFLELRFRFRHRRIAVRVAVHGHLAVSAFQRLFIRLARYTQNLVEISV